MVLGERKQTTFELLSAIAQYEEIAFIGDDDDEHTRNTGYNNRNTPYKQ